MSTPKIKGVRVEIGEVGYIVPPLSLGSLSLFQERVAALGEDVSPLDPAFQRLAVEVIHAAMVRNYPSMSVADVGNLIDLGNMPEAWAACFDAGGVERKKQEAADKAAGEAQPSLLGMT